jgi:hypothetical protein
VLDPRVERGALGPWARVREDHVAELVSNGLPVQLDVVVAVHQRDRVPGLDEGRQRAKDIGVTGRHAAQLHARVVLRAAEAVLALLVGGWGLEDLAFGRDRHADEVDKISAMTSRQRSPVGFCAR